MPANGFIGFITSQGFFIGLISGTLKSDDPFDILIFTFAVTILFYMFSQLSVSYFVRFVDVKSTKFANHEHEAMLDHFSVEIEKREEIYEEGNIDVFDESEKIKKRGNNAT